MENYNSVGISQTGPAMNQSPASNSGIVSQPANTPNNPSSFLPGQTVSALTFQSNYSGKRIRVTMSPGVTPDQSAATIAIIDDQNRIVAELGSSDGVLSELFVQRQASINSATSLLNITDFSTNTGGPTAEIQSYRLLLSAFTPILSLQQQASAPQTIYLSNGTSPNTVISAAKGSLCLNSSATGQLAYNNNGSTGWTLI